MPHKRHNLSALLLCCLLLAACGGQFSAAPPTPGQLGAGAPSGGVTLTVAPSASASALSSMSPSQRAYWPTQDWRESSPAAQGLDPELLAQADRAFETEFPNIYSFLVVRHGYLVFERYYRGHNRYDAFNIKSITKSVTSALVGIALDKQYLGDLDERAAGYLGEYAALPADPRAQAITLRHLLTMSSGFEWTEDDIPRWVSSSDWVAFAVRRRLAHAPGEAFTYDTPASHLLSAILTKATHMSEAAFAEVELFQPLGIAAGSWPTDPQGYTIGGSELSLTARDLAKFGYLYLNDGSWDGAQIVPASWVKESTLERYRKVGFFGDEGYGYLWWVTQAEGHLAFFALGYGAQYVYLVPDLDLVVVITANSDIAPEAIKDPSPLIRSLILPAITSEPRKEPS